MGAAYNAAASLFGFATAGEVVDNARALANPNQMMTPAQQSLVATEANNPSSAGLTAQANGMPGDALDNLMGLTNSFGTGDSGGGGGGGGFGSSSRGGNDAHSGDSSHGDAGASNSGFSAGGELTGPGTGTSDSIDIKVSDGETVITAETTKAVNEALGENFFLALEEAFNPKAAKAQRQLGRA